MSVGDNMMDNTPEKIALELMGMVAFVEQKRIGSNTIGDYADRKWILSTYVECIRAVKGQLPLSVSKSALDKV